jgi:hypothetical protein
LRACGVVKENERITLIQCREAQADLLDGKLCHVTIQYTAFAAAPTSGTLMARA